MRDLTFFVNDVGYHTDFITIEQFKNLYYKKIEIMSELKEGNTDRAVMIFNDILDTMYPDIPKKFRSFALVYSLVASEGIGLYTIKYNCPDCNQENLIRFELLDIENKIDFKINEDVDLMLRHFDKSKGLKMSEFEEDQIIGVRIKDEFDIEWDLLSDSTKDAILSNIGEVEFEKILKRTIPCKAMLRTADNTCCSAVKTMNETVITNPIDIFGIIVNENEMAYLYQVAHQLIKRGLTLSDYNQMTPSERRFLIEVITTQEEKEFNEQQNRVY